jgi:hypothetical protein
MMKDLFLEPMKRNLNNLNKTLRKKRKLSQSRSKKSLNSF